MCLLCGLASPNMMAHVEFNIIRGGNDDNVNHDDDDARDNDENNLR